MQFETLRLAQEGAVARLALAHPTAGNPLDGRLREELLQALLQVQEGNSACLLIEADGADFSTGLPAGELAALAADRGRARAFAELGRRIVDVMHQLPMPVLAAVQGRAHGAGLGLALACDLRLAAPGASLRLPQVREGFSLDWGASWFLPRLVGGGRALELALTARELDAPTAEQLGLCRVAQGELPTAARDLASQLAAVPRHSARLAKIALYSSQQYDLSAMLELEAEAWTQCLDARSRSGR